MQRSGGTGEDGGGAAGTGLHQVCTTYMQNGIYTLHGIEGVG